MWKGKNDGKGLRKWGCLRFCEEDLEQDEASKLWRNLEAIQDRSFSLFETQENWAGFVQLVKVDTIW